jgi:hypothetical protein
MNTFNRFGDLVEFQRTITDSGLFSGVGISVRKTGTVILRSVDGTAFYDDDLENPKKIYYTLYGQEGDQNTKLYKNCNYYIANKCDKKNYCLNDKYELKNWVKENFWDVCLVEINN